MAQVVRFILSDARSAGIDVFVKGAGYFRRGVLDIAAGDSTALAAVRAAAPHATETGPLDDTLIPPPVATVDPYPEYLKHNELVASIRGGTDEIALELRAAFGTRRAVLAGAPAPLVTTHTRADMPVRVFGQRPDTGELVGVALDTTTFRTSTDNGTTWAEKFVGPFGAFGSGVSHFGVHFDVAANFMYAATTDGKVRRATLGAWNTQPWADKSPSDVPAGTGAQPNSVCVVGGGVLLYGNYNNDSPAKSAFIWRSTNNGDTWTKVLTLTGARHVHGVQVDPRKAGRVWSMVGDNHTGKGLYRSDDYGATWTAAATNRYGIAMAFPTPFAGAPELVVSEGDGLNEPHIVGFDTGQATGKVQPLVWFDKPPSDNTSNRGTARGIHATAEGDVVYFTTPEGGAVGSKAGIYVAQGPLFQRSVLLEDLTGAEPPAYPNTFRSGEYLINGTLRFTAPKFAGSTLR